MVYKKKVRTDYTKQDFIKILKTEGEEGIVRVALTLLGEARKKKRGDVLPCFLRLCQTVHAEKEMLLPPDAIHMFGHLVGLQFEIANNNALHRMERHDLLRMRDVNEFLGGHLLQLSRPLPKSLTALKQDQEVRECLIKYFCVILHSLPACGDPEEDGERPTIDAARREIFTLAISQFELSGSGPYPWRGVPDRLRAEALTLLQYFVFPVPAHFTFTNQRFLGCLQAGMQAEDAAVRQTSVRLASGLIYSGWLHIHAEDVVSCLAESPLMWLKAKRPKLLAELSMLVGGIVDAIPNSPQPLREKLIEVVSLYAMEDQHGELLALVQNTEADKLLEKIPAEGLTSNEKVYLQVVLAALEEARNNESEA
ncbi:unnamed protein product, partial [Mesorhabditis spiculigera]